MNHEDDTMATLLQQVFSLADCYSSGVCVDSKQILQHRRSTPSAESMISTVAPLVNVL
jgi:hypothetical protein